MTIDIDQLRKLNEDYASLTGKNVEGFVCPITLEDRPDAELCNGHVVNKSIKAAARGTVIQRKDVDGYFGRTIEPDLVKMLNLPVLTTQEMLRQARHDSRVVAPSGDKLDLFYDRRKSKATKERFQQVDLYEPGGSYVASPFLKTGRLDAGWHDSIDVEWNVLLTKSAITGSLVKSAYLALFRTLGYRWVLNVAGDKVRRALFSFYRDDAKIAQSKSYFGDFEGAASLIYNHGLGDTEDTLNGNYLLLHYDNGGCRDGILFAVTCLFWANNRLITVTLPSYQREGFYFVAYECYQALLADRSRQHSVHWARFAQNRFEIDPRPMKYQFTTIEPPTC